MTPPHVVRLAGPEDEEAIMQLGKQWLNPFYDEHWKRTTLRRRLSEVCGQPIFIVEDKKNGVIAFGDCYLEDDWLTAKKRLFIIHIYVDKNHRRKGIGTFLMNGILAMTKPDVAFVDSKTQAATDLYQKVGFRCNFDRVWLELRNDKV
jgi:GNAT superfamily N-acetyltransferase